MSTATETTKTTAPPLNIRKINERAARIRGILSQGKPRINGKFAYEAYFAERLSRTDLALLRSFFRHELTTVAELIELSRALRPIERELHDAQQERDERKQAEYEARQAAKAANRKPQTSTAPDIAKDDKSYVTFGTPNPQGLNADRVSRGSTVAGAGKGTKEKNKKKK